MDIDTALLELLNAVKDLSPQLWNILLRQVQIEAYQNIFWLIICILTVVVGIPIASKLGKKYDEAGYTDGDGYMWGAISLWFCVAVSAIAIPCIISSLMTYILNPEFTAIKFLLSTIQ